MRVTEVRVMLRDDGKVRAFASITFDDAFIVRGLKIVEGESGLFVAMPAQCRGDGTYQDIAHPITLSARQELESVVLEKYREVRDQGGEGLQGTGVPSPLLPPIGPIYSALKRAIPRGEDALDPGIA